MVHFLGAMQHQVAAQMVGDIAFSHLDSVHQRRQQFANSTFRRCIHITQPKAAAHFNATWRFADQMNQVRCPDISNRCPPRAQTAVAMPLSAKRAVSK
jgi:uncharacterized protein YjaZ